MVKKYFGVRNIQELSGEAKEMEKILSVLFCVLAFGMFLPRYAKGGDWTFMVYLVWFI